MEIALDYDDTFTEDPEFWRQVILLAQERHHGIKIVTFRDPGLGIDLNVLPKGCPVYYTSYKAKGEYMVGLEKNGDLEARVDVWIDDSPECITGDSEWTEEDRERWMDENV